MMKKYDGFFAGFISGILSGAKDRAFWVFIFIGCIAGLLSDAMGLPIIKVMFVWGLIGSIYALATSKR